MPSERAWNFRARPCRKRAEIVTTRHHEVVAFSAKLAAALGAAAMLAPIATGTLTRSGLYGSVRKGPIAPVCRTGVPCDAPAQVTLVFSRFGRDAARARTSAAGRYRVVLAPGYYTVRTVERIGITPNIRPAHVHVRNGHFDRLNFSIDTGIR
jgi:hypothetical protein